MLIPTSLMTKAPLSYNGVSYFYYIRYVEFPFTVE